MAPRRPIRFYVYVYNQVHKVSVQHWWSARLAEAHPTDDEVRVAYDIQQRAQAAADEVLASTSPLTGNLGTCARAILAAAKVIEAAGGEIV